jgi:hypothetical protein
MGGLLSHPDVPQGLGRNWMVHPQSAPFMQLKKPKKFQTDDDPRRVPGGRSEADLAPDEQVAIGDPSTGAICPQPGLVSSP